MGFWKKVVQVAQPVIKPFVAPIVAPVKAAKQIAQGENVIRAVGNATVAGTANPTSTLVSQAALSNPVVQKAAPTLSSATLGLYDRFENVTSLTTKSLYGEQLSSKELRNLGRDTLILNGAVGAAATYLPTLSPGTKALLASSALRGDKAGVLNALGAEYGPGGELASGFLTSEFFSEPEGGLVPFGGGGGGYEEESFMPEYNFQPTTKRFPIELAVIGLVGTVFLIKVARGR